VKPKRSVATAAWLLAAVTLVGLAWTWWHAKPPAANNAGITVATKPTPAEAAHSGMTNSPPGPSTPPNQQSPATTPPASHGRVQRSLDSNVVSKSKAKAPIAFTNSVFAPPGSTNYPRAVLSIYELQVTLARQGLSPGSLDGMFGPQTRAALKSFQQREHLPITGDLDQATRELLLLTNSPTTSYIVTSNDLARLQPLSPTWLGKSQQTALDYETVLELVSEKGQASQTLVRRLNPDVDWDHVSAGNSIELPEASSLKAGNRVAFVTIRLADKVLEAWDENTNLLAHFPCSIARRVEKRPVGELHVAVIVENPNYTFDPQNFPESSEARELNTKLVLPSGPNNPVGVAWIGLDKPGYGIHGTPNPEQVGRTESHGCFRLANWNAKYLAYIVGIGTPVYVEP